MTRQRNTRARLQPYGTSQQKQEHVRVHTLNVCIYCKAIYQSRSVLFIDKCRKEARTSATLTALLTCLPDQEYRAPSRHSFHDVSTTSLPVCGSALSAKRFKRAKDSTLESGRKFIFYERNFPDLRYCPYSECLCALYSYKYWNQSLSKSQSLCRAFDCIFQRYLFFKRELHRGSFDPPIYQQQL